MDSQKFFRLLQEILAPNTERVKAATAELRSNYYPSPDSLVLLLQLLLSGESSNIRQLAGTQARSLVPKHWKKFTADQRAQLHHKLLQDTLNENDAVVRHASARVISAIAKIDFQDGEWLDLIDLLSNAAANAKPVQKNVAVYILFALLDTSGDLFMHKFSELLKVFGRTINAKDKELRINTMLALSKMAMALDADNDNESLEVFQQLTKPMYAVLVDAVDTQDEDRVTQAFEVLQTLLGCDSRLLNKSFPELVQLVTSIAGEKRINDESRTQALSFLIQCVRYRKMKMQGMKVGEQITLKCLEIVTELGNASIDDNELTPAQSALALLDTLASSLPASQVVVPLLHALGPYVHSHDPQRRRAGITALGMCVEGAPDFVATQLQDILRLIYILLDDPEVVVRQATLRAVGKLADDLADDMGKEHKTLIPAVMKCLDFAMSPSGGQDNDMRMESIKATCNAIDSLVEGFEPEDVTQYLPDLVPRLGRLFSHPDVKTKAAAIGAMGSIAVSAKDAFLPYFEQTMNSLSEFVRLKDSEEDLNLRCATCDAMGNMAMAVGAEPFKPYVRPLMEATEEGMRLGHSRLRETSYIFWSAMAKVYESNFKPYLEGVLKALFNSLDQEETDLEVELGQEAKDLVGQEVTIAGTKVRVASATNEELDMEDDSDDMADEDDDDDEWDDFTAVTAVALEKEIAVEVVGDIMTHTKKEYLPYLEKTIEVVLPLVAHPYEGTRRTAIATLFRAYAAVWGIQDEQTEKWKAGLPLQVQSTDELARLAEIIMTSTLAIWQEEQDRETVTDINRNVAATLRLCGPGLISDESHLKSVVELLVGMTTKKHPCQQDFGDEEDFENLDESSEFDWLIIETALDAVIGLAVALGETFGELWKVFEKSILKYASSSESIERSTSVGVIAECIRAMGSAITPYTSGLLKVLLHRMSDEDIETKSNAAYAIGLLVENSTNDQEILKSYNSIMAKLEPLLQTQKARAVDNAAGCVSRMISKHPDHVPISAVLPALVELLPLKEDFEENAPVFNMVVKLYAASNPTIISLTRKLLPTLAHVLAPPEDQLQNQTREHVMQLVRFLHSKQPALVGGYPALAAVVGQ